MSAWPAVHPPDVAAVAALHARLERTQWFAPARIEELQRRQLATTARWFAARSAPFADRLRRAGLEAADLGVAGALAALPVLEREELQALGDALFVEPPPRHGPAHEASSSGSTGRRVTVRKTRVTGAFFNALTLRDYLSRDIDLRWRIAVVRLCESDDRPTWGAPLEQLHETGPMRLVAIRQPVDVVAEQVRQFRPDFVLSYARMAAELHAAGALEGVRCLQTISEVVPAGLPDALAADGIDTWDLYSCEEAGLLASECPDRRGTYHVAAESVLVEVVDDDGTPVPAGETGRVVVTDLHNLATPLVRYAVGDLGTAGAEACPCGRGAPTLGAIVGRERNLLVNRDGRRRWPTFGKLDLRPCGVSQVQLVQREPGTVIARVVMATTAEGPVRDRILDELRRSAGDDVDFVIEAVDHIARSASGKFEDFRSELPPPNR